MGNRWYIVFVALFWLASMTWLVAEKVLPPLVGGQAPDYRAALDAAPTQPPPVAWRLIWEQREIGYAATRVRPASDGGAETRSLVHFQQLEVRKVLEQLLGLFAKAIPSLGDDDFLLDLTIATRLEFDRERALRQLDTSLAVAGAPHVFTVHGEATEERLIDLIAFSGDRFPAPGDSGLAGAFRQQIELPRDALVSDAFAPNSELRNLKVGQTWTIPVYRPFPPNSPVQIIQAKAERLEMIPWNRDTVETMVVAYRGEAGSGIAAARGPIGRVWVRPDGVVLRQEVIVSNLRLIFERLPQEEAAQYVNQLDDAEFLSLFPKDLPSFPERAAE